MRVNEISGVLRRRIGTRYYYYGSITSDKIKWLTYVPVIEQSSKTYLIENIGGYQRPGSRSRMKLFKAYLMENPESFVPPILLSGPDWSFEHSSGSEDFGVLQVNGPAAIIDGQHRVGGYIALFEEENDARPVDFILFVNLTRDEETSEFVTVNSTQKGVPKSLTVALKDGYEAGRIAWSLNLEDDSPFKGKITRVTMARNHLFNLHSVAKNIERTFNHGKFDNLTEDRKLDFMIRYWTTISDVFEEQWADIRKLDDPDSRGRKDFQHKLLELTGFIAWSLIAPEILGRSYVKYVGMNWDNVKLLVESVVGIDWRKDGQYQHATGEVGGRLIKNDMERMLPSDQTPL